MKAKLVRYNKGSQATLGVLSFEGYKHSPIYTLEPPWRDNETNISCIPTGVYEVEPYTSEKYNNVYHLKSVPNREAILIHVGNYPHDTHGCILPGLGIMPDAPMVTNSQSALKEMKIIAQKFTLTIEEI